MPRPSQKYHYAQGDSKSGNVWYGKVRENPNLEKYLQHYKCQPLTYELIIIKFYINPYVFRSLHNNL